MDGEAAVSDTRRRFIGREAEMAHLLAGLDEVRRGRGQLILVSGPPGIGKSRLVAEFIGRTREDGTPAFVGRSWEAGGAPAFWPWIQVVRSYLRVTDAETLAASAGSCLADMAAMVPELGEFAGESTFTGSPDPMDDRFRLFDATATFFRNIAGDTPVIVVLEDLQAADVPSLLLLQFVTAGIADGRLLVVATYRDIEMGPDHPLVPVLGELRRSPDTTLLQVAGLDVDEAARLLEAAGGQRPGGNLVRTLHRQTGGNPLFLAEAIRLLADPAGELTDSPQGRNALPAEIRVVIERRLDGLDPATRHVLEVAAVFGNRFELGWLHRLEPRPVEELLEQLGEASSAELVVEAAGGGGYRFAHDLIRHSLYAGLAPSQRIRLHRRAAEVLVDVHAAELDDHLATIAYHYFEAAPGGALELAVEYGRRAGDQAQRSTAYEEAVRFYQSALAVLEKSESFDRTTRMDLLLSLGDAGVKAGDLPEAEDAYFRAAEIARTAGDGRRMAHAAAGYGGRFIWARAGNDTRMIPLLRDALVMLGGDDDALRVRLLSRLAGALRSRAEPEHLDALSRQAVDLARSLDDPHALIYALSGRAGAIWWPDNSEERLAIGDELVEIGEELGGVEGTVDGYMHRFVALAEMGEIAAARRQLEGITRIGGPLRLPVHHWLEGATEALLALLEGKFDTVEPRIEDLQHRAPTTPARDNVSVAAFQLFLLRREQGRLGEVEAAARRAAADFPWYPLHRLSLASTLAELGHEEEASRILADVGANGFAAVGRDNYTVPTLCLAAELAAHLGERETAATAYELLLPVANRFAIGMPEGSLGSVARYLGLASALMGDLELADHHLAAAEAVHRRVHAQPWLAHTLYDRAQLARRQGRPVDLRRAASFLTESQRLCTLIGLVHLGAKVDAALEALGKPPASKVADPQAGSFLREGDYFSVVFSDGAFQVKDSKGMRYLAVLLASPGREIHVLDLVTAIEGVDPSPRGNVDVSSGEAGGTAESPLLDSAAREAYKSRLVDLEQDIADAEGFGDGERAARLLEERDFLVAELAAAMGLGGRDRVAVSAAERARVNVTRAIRAALGRIEDHSPGLGAHLSATIHTGAFCSYTPDPRSPVHWKV